MVDYSPIMGSANIMSVPENSMCRASAAGNLSGAAPTRTSGNNTWTEHLTSPETAVMPNTTHSELVATKPGNKTSTFLIVNLGQETVLNSGKKTEKQNHNRNRLEIYIIIPYHIGVQGSRINEQLNKLK